MNPMSTPIAIDAKAAETMKHMMIEPTDPISAVCHEKYLNVGRKFGAEARSSARHERFTAKYASRKKMVTIGAILFIEPISSVS